MEHHFGRRPLTYLRRSKCTIDAYADDGTTQWIGMPHENGKLVRRVRLFLSSLKRPRAIVALKAHRRF